jgi:segregation and condensation protein A
VSLAKVADQFVSYIREKGRIDPEEMADFLVVAARLLLIKTRALLPFLYPEEEQEIAELEDQLRMYKEFIVAAKGIEKMIGKKKFMFAREFNRQAILNNMDLFAPPKGLDKETMLMVMADLLARLTPPEKMEEGTIEEEINIDDKITAIQEMLIDRIKVSFTKILARAQSKTEIIVSFLAALELMRMREVVLTQEEMFSEIFIERN